MSAHRKYLILIGVMLAIAIALRVVFAIPSWATLAALIIGWPLVGTVVTIDDDLPGGWSNPDGKYVPEWKMLWWWADLLLIRGAIVSLSFAAEEAIDGRFALVPLVAAVVMMGVGLPIFLRGTKREIARANAV